MALNQDCPVCQQNGLQGKLRKFYINFEEFITLCANEKCTYPLGLVVASELIAKQKTQQKETPSDKTAVLPQTCVTGNRVTRRGSQSGKATGDNLLPNVTTTKVWSGYTPGKLLNSSLSAKLTEVTLGKSQIPQQVTNDTAAYSNDKALKGCETVATTTVPKVSSRSLRNSAPGKKLTPSSALNQDSCTQPVNKGVDNRNNGSHKTERKLRAATAGFQAGKIAGAVQNGRVCQHRSVQLSDHVEQNDPDHITNKWFLQWENRDALCWLDVVLCLLVQSRSVRNAVQHSLKSGSATQSSQRKTYIVRTLLAAYDQAMALSKSLCDQRAADKQKTCCLPKVDGSETENVIINPSVLTSIGSPGESPANASNLLSEVTKMEVDSDAGGVVSPSASALKKSVGTMSSISTRCGHSQNLVPLKMGAGQTQSAISASWAELMVRDGDFLKARRLLNEVREQVWQEVQPKLRCEKGRKDSPVFAIPLLLHSDPDICHLFKTTYKFETKCGQCGNAKIERYTKVLPTLPKVVSDFSMDNVSHLRECFFCRAANQKRQLHFEKLAQCVMIHFVEGLSTSDLQALDFSLRGQSFRVTSVIQYKSDPSHFVIWIKHPSGDFWMECDDLDGPLCRFQGRRPHLPAGQIHVVFWERCSPITSGTENSRYSNRKQGSSSNNNSVPTAKDVKEKTAAEEEISSPLQTTEKLSENGFVSSESSTDNELKTGVVKVAPPKSVRKTFALLKQFSSQLSPVIVNRSEGGPVRGITGETIDKLDKSNVGIKTNSEGSKRSVSPIIIPAQSFPPRFNVPANQPAGLPGSQPQASVGKSTKVAIPVFEGYSSKTSVTQAAKLKTSIKEALKSDTAKTADTKSKAGMVGSFTSNIAMNGKPTPLTPAQSCPATPLATGATSSNRDTSSFILNNENVFKKPASKRKSSVTSVGRKKIRTACENEPKTCSRPDSDCVSVTPASLCAGTSPSAPNPVKSPPVSDGVQNENCSQSADAAAPTNDNPMMQQCVTELVLPDWVDVSADNSKPDLSDLLCNTLPELSDYLVDDFKGGYSDTTDQADILRDLYKALDLNISPDSDEKKEVYLTPENLPDECNPFDALISL